MASILIVDDLSSIHEMLEAVIQPTGHETEFAQDGEKALSLYKSRSFDVVLADISMQPMDGITLLQQFKEFDPQCVTIMMTGYASTDTAIKALKYGAFDYIKKPFKVEELLETLERAIEYKAVRANAPAAETASRVAADEESRIAEALPGKSERITRLRQQLAKLADSRTPVLLQGEKGTGKKVIAGLLHRDREDRAVPMVSVDCEQSDAGAFRESLFGDDGQGGRWIADAAGGTLFLEHIETLSEELQGLLVGVLKNNINRFRLICSSGIDLEEKVDEGEFNDELFYRIATLPVNLPPLREHGEDIPDIVRSRIARVESSGFDTRRIEFTGEALEALTRYGWPGNLAELDQVVSQVVSSATDRVIGLEALPLRVRPFNDWPTLEEYLAPRERHYVRVVLNACAGDETKAAEILGCDPSRISNPATT